MNHSKPMLFITISPGIKTADADAQQMTSTGDWQSSMPTNFCTTNAVFKEDVPRYGIFAKYAAAFFRKAISASRSFRALRNRAFSSDKETFSEGICPLA